MCAYIDIIAYRSQFSKGNPLFLSFFRVQKLVFFFDHSNGLLRGWIPEWLPHLQLFACWTNHLPTVDGQNPAPPKDDDYSIIYRFLTIFGGGSEFVHQQLFQVW